MQHELANRTFEDVYRALRLWKPVNVVMEQTQGFEMPIHKGSKHTPLSQCLVLISCHGSRGSFGVGHSMWLECRK